MSLELPTTGTELAPAFLTRVACEDWLATVPLANAVQAQSMLLRQLDLLNRYSMPAKNRLALLETLRGPLADVQDDAARKYAAKPLPLAPSEQAAFDSNLALWRELAVGYLHCFEAARGGDVGVTKHAASIAQRTLTVFADWQVELFRGQQVPDGEYWRQLNEIFAAAEALGVAGAPVDDPLYHGSNVVSPLAAYAECQLLHTASPYELPTRHQAWVTRWARRWGAKLGLLKLAPEDIAHRAVPLCVDLDSQFPANYQPRSGAGARWLDTTALRASLATRLTLLEQGRAPADVQLGDDCTQPAAGQLLTRLLQRWCRGGAPRRHERRAASGSCRFVIGLEAVHYHLSGGKVFRAPTSDDAMLRQEREELATFGTRRDDGKEEPSFPIEQWQAMDDWQMLDESAGGVRLGRPLKEGARVGAGILVAVHPAGGSGFVLGSVRWVLRTNVNALSSGIQLYPGVPQAVAMRPANTGQREKWQQAFLLPPVPVLGEPGSVVVPVGTFRIGRSIEVKAGDYNVTAKLTQVLDRGNDYERCLYE